MKPNVVIYRNACLNKSETFIFNQVKALRRYGPTVAGVRAVVDGLDLSAFPVVTLENGSALQKLELASFRLLSIAPRFRRRLASSSPVLVHAHFGTDGAQICPLVERLGVPLVVTYHGFDATMSEESLRRSRQHVTRNYLKRKKRLINSASAYTCDSEYIRGRLIEQGFPRERLHVHYVGVDTDEFVPDNRVPREPVVLYVGRLTPKKGGLHLIQAMEIVQQQCEDAELVVIGSGELEAEMKKEAEHRLPRHRFLGFQPPAVVKKWMNRARVFSCPSIIAPSGDAEGFQITALEAQAMGLPCAMFDTPPIPENVAHEVSGLLAPQQDTDKLAENIVALMRQDDLWQQMSVDGRKRAVAKFNLHRQTAKLEDLYDRVTASTHREM